MDAFVVLVVGPIEDAGFQFDRFEPPWSPAMTDEA
jgi:hypothetical protein